MYATTKYFKKRQNLAIGILCTGYALGLLSLVPLLQMLIDNVGFKKTLWIMCGTVSCFFLVVFATFDTNIKDDTVIEENHDDQQPTNRFLQYLQVFKRPAFVMSAAVAHIQCGSGGAVSVYLVS